MLTQVHGFSNRLHRSFQNAASGFVRPETTLIALICILDMASTIVLVQMGMATESNPLLRPFLERGELYFVLVKTLTFIVPLTLLEMLRRRHPELVVRMLRVGLFGYLAIYVLGSAATLTRI